MGQSGVPVTRRMGQNLSFSEKEKKNFFYVTEIGAGLLHFLVATPGTIF